MVVVAVALEESTRPSAFAAPVILSKRSFDLARMRACRAAAVSLGAGLGVDMVRGVG